MLQRDARGVSKTRLHASEVHVHRIEYTKCVCAYVHMFVIDWSFLVTYEADGVSHARARRARAHVHLHARLSQFNSTAYAKTLHRPQRHSPLVQKGKNYAARRLLTQTVARSLLSR